MRTDNGICLTVGIGLLAALIWLISGMARSWCSSWNRRRNLMAVAKRDALAFSSSLSKEVEKGQDAAGCRSPQQVSGSPHFPVTTTTTTR